MLWTCLALAAGAWFGYDDSQDWRRQCITAVERVLQDQLLIKDFSKEKLNEPDNSN